MSTLTTIYMLICAGIQNFVVTIDITSMMCYIISCNQQDYINFKGGNHNE